MKRFPLFKHSQSRSVVSALAIAAAIAAGMAITPQTGFVGAAFADEDGEGGQGGQGSGQGNQGGQGQGGQGSQSGQDNQGGQGAGQGGPDPDSDSKGPQAGGPKDTDSGGKPVWAQEGIPEVELGRLNVARSPSHVLDRALAEALNSMTPEMVDFYNMDLVTMIDALKDDFDDQVMLDSPLQNLALLRDALDGTTDLTDYGVTRTADDLVPVFLGVASDKTVPVSTDTVTAITTILGQPVSKTEAEAIADEAEAIREAVLEGHG